MFPKRSASAFHLEQITRLKITEISLPIPTRFILYSTHTSLLHPRVTLTTFTAMWAVRSKPTQIDFLARNLFKSRCDAESLDLAVAHPLSATHFPSNRLVRNRKWGPCALAVVESSPTFYLRYRDDKLHLRGKKPRCATRRDLSLGNSSHRGVNFLFVPPTGACTHVVRVQTPKYLGCKSLASSCAGRMRFYDLVSCRLDDSKRLWVFFASGCDRVLCLPVFSMF